ncbi:ABC transporter substrate-binding protein [Frankia sp. R82]|uniref:ABC transporter substrate-binding protein n=1 Tax=Frankia sp. R82 TaxID=2950553 RepID=UPI0020445DAF|nr:ABC transporter substrate-binding protein [Frankia sp. R82]MCM3882974.1 ABC transporter substrate-binding protein [Frankia sp. R82]
MHPSDKKGGTLRAVNDSDCDYWDPARTYYANCWDQQRWISRQLVTFAPRPGEPQLVGDLATSAPTPADLKTWKYTLKDGLKFSDGTPITSKDVKYAVERVFATDVINGGPTYLIDYLDDPANPYPGPYKDTDPNKLGLKSVETPDDHTIIFHLNKPFGDWNYVMAQPGVTPVPKAKDTGANYTFKPMSSGPYMVEKYTPNKSISFVRNPYWDPKTDTVNKALPDRIEETMGLDLDDIDNRLLANSADFYVGQTGVQITAQNKVLGDPSLRADRTTDDLSGFIRYLSVVTTVKPFDNIHCRNAVAYAIDKTAQQLARGGPVGGGDIATTMLTPPLKYYASFDLFPSAGHRGDIAKARQELTACGQPNGFATTLATRSNGKEVAQAEAVQASLAKIGIKVTINKSAPSQYFSSTIGIPANVHKNGIGLAMAGWGPDWPAPYAMLSSIVDGRKILSAGNSNYAELNDPTVNKGLDEGVTTTDEAKAQQIWTRTDRAIVASAADVPLLYDKALNLFSNRLTNIYFTTAYNMTDFAQFGVMR